MTISELEQHDFSLRKWGDPVLRQPCAPVNVVGPVEQTLAELMLDIMDMSNGVGLAAPQIGLSLRLCVIDVPEDAEKEECVALNAAIPMPLMMFNPEILIAEGEQTDSEGCLSFPSIPAPVTRANKVVFSFLDANGKRQMYTAYGLLARAVQHELDHLDGKVFVDYVADKSAIEAKLNKLEAKTRRKLKLD